MFKHLHFESLGNVTHFSYRYVNLGPKYKNKKQPDQVWRVQKMCPCSCQRDPKAELDLKSLTTWSKHNKLAPWNI